MKGFTLLFLLAAAVAWPASAQQHAGSATPADVEAGARLYSANCTACHGANGDSLAGVDLRRGPFRRGTSDEDLTRTITKGIPGTAMVPVKLSESETSQIIAYLRSMGDFKSGLTGLGRAERGRLILEKQDCLTCHRVAGKGQAFAPDLSAIGAVRSADALERTLMDALRYATPHRYIRAVTAQGRVVHGRRLNEDTFTIQLVDDSNRLVSLSKTELREFTVVKNSRMPSYAGKLSAAEAADLVAYLLTLKETPKVKP